MLEIRNEKLCVGDSVIGDEDRVLEICGKALKCDEYEKAIEEYKKAIDEYKKVIKYYGLEKIIKYDELEKTNPILEEVSQC